MESFKRYLDKKLQGRDTKINQLQPYPSLTHIPKEKRQKCGKHNITQAHNEKKKKKKTQYGVSESTAL